jgi:hypothetical protein
LERCLASAFAKPTARRVARPIIGRLSIGLQGKK